MVGVIAAFYAILPQVLLSRLFMHIKLQINVWIYIMMSL